MWAHLNLAVNFSLIVHLVATFSAVLIFRLVIRWLHAYDAPPLLIRGLQRPLRWNISTCRFVELLIFGTTYVQVLFCFAATKISLIISDWDLEIFFIF